MDYFLLFIGLLTLSALGYTIYKLNNKSEPIDDPQKRLDEINQVLGAFQTSKEGF